MQLTDKRAELVKKALLCYVSHLIDTKFKRGITALDAKREVGEALNIVRDIKAMQDRKTITDELDDIEDLISDVPFEDMEIKTIHNCE